MASQCSDRTSASSSYSSTPSSSSTLSSSSTPSFSSSSFSTPLSCFSTAKRDASISTALHQFNSCSVRYPQQLACELETKEETAFEVEDHDDSLDCTIGQPHTELRTRPTGIYSCQPVASKGRFDNTSETTTNVRTDSNARLLLRSFGSSDGWSEASNLQRTMAIKKHSAEGFCKKNAMGKCGIESESNEVYVSSTPSSGANLTTQWTNPQLVLKPFSLAVPTPRLCESSNHQGNLLSNLSLDDFITHVAIPPPAPTSPSLVAAETGMHVPKPPLLLDIANPRLTCRPEIITHTFGHSLKRTTSKELKHGGVSPPLKTTDVVQLSPLTTQRIQPEDAAQSRRGEDQTNLYGPMSENNAEHIRLEENFAKLVTPPPPPPHQITKNGEELQRPVVLPPPPPVSADVGHPLLLTLPPHPPPTHPTTNRYSSRGHKMISSPSFPNRPPPAYSTLPRSCKLSVVETMNGCDETRLSPSSSAPNSNQRNVYGSSSRYKSEDGDDASETTVAMIAADARSLSSESSPNVSARDETYSFSADVVTKQQTHSRTHSSAATLPRTAPPIPPPRHNSTSDSNSAMDKRRRIISFDQRLLQKEGPDRRESCPPSNTKRSSRRDSCSPPPPLSSNHEESSTRRSRRNEGSSSLSRLISAATRGWVGCRQTTEPTAQIRQHAIRSSSSSAFQSIVKDNESSGALAAEAAGNDFSRKVRSGSLSDASACDNVSVFSNLKSKLRSYWSPSMSKRKSFLQRSSIDQSSVVVSSSSSRRSSSIDDVDYALENPDGNPKNMVSPRRRSASRNRVDAGVTVGSVIGTPSVELEYDLPLSLRQNAPNTFNTFTGMPPVN